MTDPSSSFVYQQRSKLVLVKFLFRISAGTPGILKFFLFLLSPSGQIPEHYLHSATAASFRTFQIRHSLVVRTFGSMQCELLTDHKVLFVCFWRDSPQWAMASSFTRFLDHTQRRITVGRTPLGE